MKTNKLIILILILMITSCQNNKSSKVEKNTKSRGVQISNDILKSDTINNFNPIRKKDTTLNHFYNVDVYYLLTLPNNIIEHSTNRNDSSIYIYPDSSLVVTTWIIYDYLSDYKYQRDKYGDVQVVENDTVNIFNHFKNISDNLVDKIVSSFGIIKYRVEKSKNEIHLKGICGKYTILDKLLLCNVDGGTQVVVSLNIKFLPKRKKIAYEIFNNTKTIK